MKLVLLIASVVCIAARIVEAGECCRSYSNLFVTESAKYCSDYCCGDSSLKLTCCDSVLARAPSSDRTSFCADWFTSGENVWAPILIGLAFVGSIVGCCCCCYHCCCKSNTHTTVVMPQQPGMAGTNMVAVSNTTAAGYPGHYPPPGQGPYPSGAGYYPPGTGQQPAGSHPDAEFQKT